MPLILTIATAIFILRNFLLPTLIKPICTENDYSLGAWEACIEGTQVRVVEIKEGVVCREKIKPALDRPCSVENKTLLLRDYTTQVDPENLNNFYEQNNNNFKIVPTGKFKNLKLHLSAITTVLSGKPIQVPEYYYFMFSLGEEIPRALEATRIDETKLDISGSGIIKGTDMPTEKIFDLNNTILAVSSHEYSPGGIGRGAIGSHAIGAGDTTFLERSFLELLNENEGVELSGTLFMGDGRSMTVKNLNERIFGTINFAYFEYECVEGVNCEIHRIPKLEP